MFPYKISWHIAIISLYKVGHLCCLHECRSVKTLYDDFTVTGLKGSLERLQLEYVDVVFANKPDVHTPMEGMKTFQGPVVTYKLISY